MNSRNFARQRALILNRGRGDRHQRRAMSHLVREADAQPIHAGGKLVGYRMPDGFVVCEKRRYRDRAAAMAELDNVHAFAHLHPNKRLPVRAYPCPWCGGWHVTSRA